jgi:hypothetical protein
MMAQSPSSPFSPYNAMFDDLSPPPLAAALVPSGAPAAASSGDGIMLTLNNSGGDTLSPSPLQQYADMIVLSPTPSPGLDIDREMEIIR